MFVFSLQTSFIFHFVSTIIINAPVNLNNDNISVLFTKTANRYLSRSTCVSTNKVSSSGLYPNISKTYCFSRKWFDTMWHSSQRLKVLCGKSPFTVIFSALKLRHVVKVIPSHDQNLLRTPHYVKITLFLAKYNNIDRLLIKKYESRLIT